MMPMNVHHSSLMMNRMTTMGTEVQMMMVMNWMTLMTRLMSYHSSILWCSRKQYVKLLLSERQCPRFVHCCVAAHRYSLTKYIDTTFVLCDSSFDN